MFVEEKDIRFRIFRLLVDSKRMMTLSEIANKLRIPQQNVSYHLPFLERGGLIIREDAKYFCQPLFLDEEINGFCANRMSDIVGMFSERGNAIFAEVKEEDERDEIIMNCLLGLILLQIYPDGKN